MSTNRVGADIPPITFEAVFPHKELVEELHQFPNRFGGVRDDPALEVSPPHRLRPHARTRQIGRSEKGALPVDDDTFHVIPRAKDTLKAVRPDQIREAIKIRAKSRSGLLRMNQPDLDTVRNKIIKEPEKGVELLSPRSLNMKVLQIRRRHPEKPFRRRNQFLENGFMDRFIQNQPIHENDESVRA